MPAPKLNSLLSGATIAGVLGQYFFGFIIEGTGDFLGKNGRVIEFVMEEKIGGDVPIFSLTFKTLDSSIISKLNEGARISCWFGKDINQNKYAEMQIQKFNHSVMDSFYTLVNIKGLIFNGINYLRDNEQKSYPKKTSIEVMKEVASKYFQVTVETSETANDAMNWFRPNHSPHRFLNDVWKRSYLNDNNALIYAIEMSGKFLITDINKISQQKTKWYLKQFKDGDKVPLNTAAYEPDYTIVSDFGLLNNMVTNTKITPIHSSTDGAAKKVSTPKISPVMVSGGLNISGNSPTKTEIERTVDTDNFHDNYSKSRLVNIPKVAMLNSLEVEIHILGRWQDYELLDLIHFTPWRPTKDPNNSEMNSLGGLYAITNITRFFANNRAAIKITISKDGINGQTGSLFGDTPDYLSSLLSPITELLPF